MNKRHDLRHDDHDDAPELTQDVLARGRPGSEVLPAAVLAGLKRTPGRPKAENPKQHVNLRLNAEVLEHFKAKGAGWQTRINAALEEAVRREKAG